jgi:hypothetical protein
MPSSADGCACDTENGHRAGHDAMLLAAATSARRGARVVDFGAGVGAAGLRWRGALQASISFSSRSTRPRRSRAGQCRGKCDSAEVIVPM